MDASVKARIKKSSISARVIRANGKIENYGVVSGGTIVDRIKNKIISIIGR